MKWLPPNNAYEARGFSSQKLIAGTGDGKLLCIDLEGNQFASIQLESPLLCLDTDGKIVVGGCADGSVRVWMMQTGKISETQRFTKAHTGAVTAIAIGTKVENGDEIRSHAASSAHQASEMLVTGSDDCSIRVWRLGYEQ